MIIESPTGKPTLSHEGKGDVDWWDVVPLLTSVAFVLDTDTFDGGPPKGKADIFGPEEEDVSQYAVAVKRDKVECEKVEEE